MMLTWLMTTTVCFSLAHELGRELEPDEEHEQDQPDLAERRAASAMLLAREDASRRRSGANAAEERRPEEDAGRDLADHRGLAEASSSIAIARAETMMMTICSRVRASAFIVE